MSTIVQSGKPAGALEITATLARRRIGITGYDVGEAQRISEVLCGAASIPVPFEERVLSEFGQVCDALVIRLASLSPEGLRAAAASPAPVLVTSPGEAVLDRASAAYGWPCDFMIEHWSEAELVLRLFRLLQRPRGPPGTRLANSGPSATSPPGSSWSRTTRAGRGACRTTYRAT